MDLHDYLKPELHVLKRKNKKTKNKSKVSFVFFAFIIPCRRVEPACSNCKWRCLILELLTYAISLAALFLLLQARRVSYQCKTTSHLWKVLTFSQTAITLPCAQRGERQKSPDLHALAEHRFDSHSLCSAWK